MCRLPAEAREESLVHSEKGGNKSRRVCRRYFRTRDQTTCSAGEEPTISSNIRLTSISPIVEAVASISNKVVLTNAKSFTFSSSALTPDGFSLRWRTSKL